MLSGMGRAARAAFGRISRASSDARNRVLVDMADLLGARRAEILGANARDVESARSSGMADALVDRLILDEKRLLGLAKDCRNLADLPDPVGERYDECVRPNGLRLCRQRVPLGVVGVIYESRPNVTIDVSGLAVKTGNAVLLRGGKETLHSNSLLAGLARSALERNGLPADAVQFLDNPDRAMVLELLRLHAYVDVIVPRGGEGLHRFCRENSRIPVITGGVGVCHIFVDASADVARALEVIHNAKTQRPTVCNALDTVLVDRAAAGDVLPRLVRRLAPAGVRFRAHESAVPFLTRGGTAPLPAPVEPAGPEDFDTEWMSLVLGVKVVDGIDAAIEHTNAHSMGHSDAILTGDRANADRWIREVDSAAVYVNASTRFTDGGQFGLGAEVAISTQRLHARGPMGLRELTTYKWVGEGDYLCRE